MDDLALSTLIPLDQVDAAALEDVLDRAFEPTRRQRTSYLIRGTAESLPPLCFAALDESGELVGTIQAFPVALTDPAGKVHPLIMVGPVAIVPEHQGQGFGRALMAAQTEAIEDARMQGAPALPQVLIGDAPYYGKFGFVETPRGWTCPGPWDPARLLVRGANPVTLPQHGVLGPWLD